MDEFVSYIKGVSGILNKRAFIKDDISNNFVPEQPSIGFSDDDEKNVEKIKDYFKSIKEPVKTYSTKGGIKKEY